MDKLEIIPIKDETFQKIICFYLFECPARSVHLENKKRGEERTKDQPHPSKRFCYSRISQLGRTFEERGIVGGKFNTLRTAMIHTAGDEFELLFGSELNEPSKKEYISIVRTECKTEGAFAFIRNAFAHGEFYVSNGWYSFENHNRGRLVGKALIREATLLKWIEVINTPVSEMKRFYK